jgi:UDP-GlcNAc:undecaprenyl-phosphate/decaprenyl-phosphate GlcNAc-1-phosphate transferase
VSELGAAALLGMVAGAAVAAGLLVSRLRSAPAALARINVSGRRVPAVLGDSLIGGSLAAVAVVALASGAADAVASSGEMGAAAALVVAVLGVAGRFDDLRGDEAERGFGGHLRAAARGRLTGGLVKILAGVAAGLGAGAIAFEGVAILAAGALVALTANLFNLLDRAPGRAAKYWLLVVAPLMLLGEAGFTLAAAGMLGAVLVCLPVDLGETAMLGDAGSNSMGGLAGLGLAAAFHGPERLAVLVVVLALNLASERWSFSQVIEAVAPLRALDRLGRSGGEPRTPGK